MRLRTILASACLAGLALTAPAHAKPPLEAFSDLPAVGSPDISPDGKYVAYISRINGSVFPAEDPALTSSAPPVGSPG